MTLHPAAWTLWLASAAVVAFAVSSPLVGAAAFGAVVLVRLASPPDDSPASRAFRAFLVVGAVLVVVRLAFVPLLDTPGTTVLTTLRRWELPPWLGGFGIGGAVTAESLVASAADGLRLLVVLAAFGVWGIRVDVARLLRMVPAPFREAGLVVSIAAAFVPGLLRTARDVRDAQRMRGESRWRTLVPSLAVPILGLAVERAFLLAESMEVRGYGRGTAPAPARAPLLGGLGAILAGLALWTAGLRGGAGILVAGGGLGLVWTLRRMVAASGVTRLRAPRWRRTDTLVALAATGAVGVALVGPGYDPYPTVAWPPLPLAGTLILTALLAAPAAADLLGGRR